MLKYFAIQRPKQKSKVMHTMVIIITITPNCVIILHYTTYMLYFILMYFCIPVLKFTPVYVIPKVPIFSIFTQNKPIIMVVFCISMYI